MSNHPDTADSARGEPPTPKGKRSRRTLIDAAQRVFSRDGFVAARITDIVAEANVAYGTFYTYFESKEEIFLELLRELETRLAGTGEKDRSGSDEPIDHIIRANREYLWAYLDNAPMMIVWEQVATVNPEVENLRREASDRFTRRSRAAIVRWQKAGLANPAIDPEYAAVALTGMVSNFVYRWCATGGPYDLDRAAEQLSLLWASSLGLTVTRREMSANARTNVGAEGPSRTGTNKDDNRVVSSSTRNS